MIVITSAAKKTGIIKTRVFYGLLEKESATDWLQDVIKAYDSELTESDRRQLQLDRLISPVKLDIWLEKGGFIFVHSEVVSI